MWPESLNKLLYSSKLSVYFLLRIASLLTAFVTLGLTVARFGFYLEDDLVNLLNAGFDLAYIAYLINYLLRLLYSFRRANFLYRTSLEIFFLLFVGLSYLLEDFYAFSSEIAFYKYCIAPCLIFLSIYELVKISTRINLVAFKPTTMFLLSFLLLIFVGTALLMLPTASYGKKSMPFIDAFFTATSAGCVTGLSVVDISSYFTFKGQLIILVLFQLGGLGIISFATFFSTFFTNAIGIRHQTIVQDIYSTESLISARGLFKTIIFITLAIELLFTVFVFFSWTPDVYFTSVWQKFYYSLFHAVAAFCNAGFSLYPDGIYEPVLRTAYLLHIVLAFAVILGGLGFPVLDDLFNIRKLRDRLKYPWKDWHLSTKVALYTSLALLIFGTLSFYLLERENVLQDMNFMEKIVTSFFQSVVTRSAGFQSVDLGRITDATVIIMVFLMFIGASPASTGGGIKTSTFLIIFATAIATITEKGKVEIGRRTITQDIIFRAFSVFAFAVAFNFLSLFVLILAEPGKMFIDLLFEQVSAFGTVGLSKGITSSLSAAGKIVIAVSMFVGRVGILTLAIAISKRASAKSYRYPNAHLMVG